MRPRAGLASSFLAAVRRRGAGFSSALVSVAAPAAAATLVAVALLPQGPTPTEAAKLKSKSKAPSAASFSELQGITTKVDVIESKGKQRKKIKAKKKDGGGVQSGDTLIHRWQNRPSSKGLKSK